jgi:hypothetical protein
MEKFLVSATGAERAELQRREAERQAERQRNFAEKDEEHRRAAENCWS